MVKEKRSSLETPRTVAPLEKPVAKAPAKKVYTGKGKGVGKGCSNRAVVTSGTSAASSAPVASSLGDAGELDNILAYLDDVQSQSGTTDSVPLSHLVRNALSNNSVPPVSGQASADRPSAPLE